MPKQNTSAAIEALIGSDNSDLLRREFGGRSVYVSTGAQKGRVYARLVALVGEDNVQKLHTLARSGILYVPARSSEDVRNANLRAEHIRSRYAHGESVVSIAADYDLTTRAVYYIVQDCQK